LVEFRTKNCKKLQKIAQKNTIFFSKHYIKNYKKTTKKITKKLQKKLYKKNYKKIQKKLQQITKKITKHYKLSKLLHSCGLFDADSTYCEL
jgi:hypothetical protein